MEYKRSQMVFYDYKWTAKAGNDNPRFIGAQERSMLNRSEGYEMLWFINSLAKTWGWTSDQLASYQNLERIIRENVPSEIRTHDGIRQWIANRYESI